MDEGIDLKPGPMSELSNLNATMTSLSEVFPLFFSALKGNIFYQLLHSQNVTSGI